MFVSGQSLRPTKPVKAVDTVKLPEPVKDQDTMDGIIPENVKFGIITKLEGKIHESYNFYANVKDIKEGSLTLVSKNDQPADIMYKLPKGMGLKISRGDDIAIYRKTLIVGGGQSYDQHIKKGSSLKLASSKLYGEKPIENQLLTGVSIKQTTIDPSSTRQSEYMKSSNVKVVLSQRSGSTMLSHGKITDVFINRINYQVYVQASSYTEAKPGSIEPEFQGYLLEYYVVEK